MTLLVMTEKWKVNAVKELFDGRMKLKIMMGVEVLKTEWEKMVYL